MKYRAPIKFLMVFLSIILMIQVNVFATEEEKEFKVLFIGNSFSADATDADYSDDSILFEIMKSMVGDNVKISVGVAMSGAKPFAWHATSAESNNPVYTFIYFDNENNRQILGSSDRTSEEVLTYTDWDAIVLQPYAEEIEKRKSKK